MHKINKLLHFAFIADRSWKMATVASFFVLFFIMIFTNIHAADTITNRSAQADRTCQSGFGVVPAQAVIDAVVGQGFYCLRPENKTPADNSGLSTNIIAKDPTSSSATSGGTGFNYDYKTSEYYHQGGALTATMFGAGALYDMRPASTYDAVVYQANNAGLISHAQVQGFNQFAPISILWGIFRNIALLLFVVVFVAIGFFILLQRKIGGQETVSLVSGITNAAVAMVVITFSYAIGGFIVDIFSNVMNGIVATTFNSFINSQELLGQLNTPNSGVNVLTLMNDISNIGVSQSALNLFQTSLAGAGYPLNDVKQVFSTLNFGQVGVFNVGSTIGFFASIFVDILMGIIQTGFNNNALITAIISFVIFIVTLRIVFTLIGAYISIVFKIMFAPFILLPAAFPGNAGKAIFGWLTSLIASALTFPAIFGCILMAAIFLNLNANITDNTGKTSECVYNSQANPGNPSTIQGNTKPAKWIVVNRFGKDTNDASNKGYCFPLALPPEFNYWPAPLGYINGVQPDDLIRFVVALAFIVLAPSIPKLLQKLLKVEQDSLTANLGATLRQGASTFGSFASSIPSFGVGRGIGTAARSIAESTS